MWLHICKLDAPFLIEGEGLYPICGTCEYPCNVFLFQCVGQISQDYSTTHSESLLNEILLFIFE